MAKQLANNIRLGIFVISGVVLLAIALYLIGQNQNFFGSNFTVKARFKNVNGLMPGNNVRFSGIQCGTVKSIKIINDSTLEVTLLINNKTSSYIRKNSLAGIGNEGLMGNKVVNITPNSIPSPQIEDGGMLQPQSGAEMNDMLGTLSVTNDNAAIISEDLKQMVKRLNDNPVIWRILSDTTIPVHLHQSLSNLQGASVRIDHAAQSIDRLINDVKKGKGTAGMLLTDTIVAKNLTDAIAHISSASAEANILVERLDNLANGIYADINGGNNVVHALLKDSLLVMQLNRSLSNIEKGTAAFYEDMEALKHNFLLRGYFRKQERNKNK